MRLTPICWFCRSILKMFNEIHYWERMNFDIPPFAFAICQHKDDLHTLRENALLLVKDYNRSAEQCKNLTSIL